MGQSEPGRFEKQHWIGSWTREFSKVFGTKPTFGKQLGVKWGQAEKTVGEVFEYTDDLEEALMVDKSWPPTYASSNKIVLTSIHSATYEALWVGMSYTWTDRAGNAQEATYLCIHWASVIVDEVHKVRAKKNPLMTDALMQDKSSFYNTPDGQPPRFPRYPLLPPTQMWFISGTFALRSSSMIMITKLRASASDNGDSFLLIYKGSSNRRQQRSKKRLEGMYKVVISPYQHYVINHRLSKLRDLTLLATSCD